MKLLLASGNAKKLAELQRIAAPLGVEVVSPRDVGGLPEVEEDGATFLANAAKKASSGARASGLWTLADDSGLCVDALDGAPGIFSARYAGTHGDDAGNNASSSMPSPTSRTGTAARASSAPWPSPEIGRAHV